MGREQTPTPFLYHKLTLNKSLTAESGVLMRWIVFMAETTFTCIQWLQKYKEELEKIKDSSPFLLMLGISAGIEFMGKLLYIDPLDDGNNCGDKFEKALSEFDSLKKYSGKNLYSLIRCGLAHKISVKEGIVLSKESKSKLNEIPIVINTNVFFDDFVIAVDDAQEKKKWANKAATQNYVIVKNETDTGVTATFL